MEPASLVVILLLADYRRQRSRTLRHRRCLPVACHQHSQRPGQTVAGFQQALAKLPLRNLARPLRCRSAGCCCPSANATGTPPASWSWPATRLALECPRSAGEKLKTCGKDKAAPMLQIWRQLLPAGLLWSWNVGPGVANEHEQLRACPRCRDTLLVGDCFLRVTNCTSTSAGRRRRFWCDCRARHLQRPERSRWKARFGKAWSITGRNKSPRQRQAAAETASAPGAWPPETGRVAVDQCAVVAAFEPPASGAFIVGVGTSRGRSRIKRVQATLSQVLRNRTDVGHIRRRKCRCWRYVLGGASCGETAGPEVVLLVAPGGVCCACATSRCCSVR